MTPDQIAVIEAVVAILKRKPQYKPLAPERFLELTMDDLGLDSVEKLDLVMDLEDRFDLVFTTSEVVKCQTIDELVDCVRGQRIND